MRVIASIKGATLVFMKDFEICGTCDASKRIEYAHQVYDAFANKAASTTGAITCFSPTLGSDVAAGVCVESPDDHAIYQCDGGDWVDAETAPTDCSELHAVEITD